MNQLDLFGRGTAIFLCNLTMNMPQPWLDAGYRVVLVDPQHPVTGAPGAVERISATVLGATARLGEILRSERIVFVAGFPPCTDVAVSGSRWFAEKRAKDPHFQAKAAIVAEQCRMVGALSGAPGFFENPVSVFSSIFGKPGHIFSPDEYTGFCRDDNYTKTTCLWPVNDFVMPAPNRDEALGPPDDRIHKAPPRAGARQLPQRHAARLCRRSVPSKQARPEFLCARWFDKHTITTRIMPKLTYLSGPMTGLPESNKLAFHAEAARLRALGLTVINPAEIELPPGATWSDYMRADLIEMLKHCGSICMLAGWELSEGAVLELTVARKLGFEVSLAGVTT